MLVKWQIIKDSTFDYSSFSRKVVCQSRTYCRQWTWGSVSFSKTTASAHDLTLQPTAGLEPTGHFIPCSRCHWGLRRNTGYTTSRRGRSLHRCCPCQVCWSPACHGTSWRSPPLSRWSPSHADGTEWPRPPHCKCTGKVWIPHKHNADSSSRVWSIFSYQARCLVTTEHCASVWSSSSQSVINVPHLKLW